MFGIPELRQRPGHISRHLNAEDFCAENSSTFVLVTV